METAKVRDWPVRLFNKSVLKQRKLKEVVALLGPSQGLHCLDIGSDNGVVSYLLRQRGGSWKSADLDPQAVAAIRALVKTNVYQLDGGRTPFEDEEFDRVLIVDFLEHIPDDSGFIQEVFRILKPGGELIVNVPHVKNTLLRRLRLALGQTDEKHGHLRPGYTLRDLRRIFGEAFVIQEHHTYSKFFSEFIDTLMVFAISLLQRRKQQKHTSKGLIVTGEDLSKNQALFRLYSLIYPVVWVFAQLDRLLFFTSGYMLIVRAQVNKPTIHQHGGTGWHKDQPVLLKEK
jgi:SAM-dependent methyltransferase